MTAPVGAPVPGTVTVMPVDPSTTWLFVSTRPDAVSTIPVPAPSPPVGRTVPTSTTPAVGSAIAVSGVPIPPGPSEAVTTRVQAAAAATRDWFIGDLLRCRHSGDRPPLWPGCAGVGRRA